MRWLVVPVTAVLCSGCASLNINTGSYMSVPDHVARIRNAGPAAVTVGTFAGPSDFRPICRALAIGTADNLTHVQYIEGAFRTEFTNAGLHVANGSRIVLSGDVTKLNSSSPPFMASTWEIDLTLKSSNGRQISVSERREFRTSFEGVQACVQTAGEFLRAVQGLVGRAVNDSGFPALLH